MGAAKNGRHILRRRQPTIVSAAGQDAGVPGCPDGTVRQGRFTDQREEYGWNGMSTMKDHGYSGNGGLHALDDSGSK